MAQKKLLTRYDAIIVGSGIAGLLVALELDRRGMRTALICKGRLMESNTSWAQGGIAICTGTNPLDSTESHLKDTLSAGAGLCDEAVAKVIVESGSRLFEKLESLGLSFDRNESALELAREGGHSASRVLHSKDASGKAITEALVFAARQSKRLAIFEHMFAFDLIRHADRCIGLRVLNDNNAIEILAPRVILASGGLGQVFDRTTNPSIATGDGIAMAYRAGAELVDMEFVQFHPTALFMPGAPASLISEAVRGSGAHLLDANGQRFAFRFHKDGELATRDVVSRAIMTVMREQRTSCAWLDMRPIGAADILEKYPNIVQSCRNWGLDPLDRPIPVSPAAHYFMGGISTDDCGRSSLRGLYAIGECASTGLHGANRLASNSLLEGGVMALRVADAIAAEKQVRMPTFGLKLVDPVILSPESINAENISDFRKSMFAHAGLRRDGDSLAKIVMDQFDAKLHPVEFEQTQIEAANIGLLGMLIARSAMMRCESRGAHYRSDFPERNDEDYLKRYFVSNQSSKYLDLKSGITSVSAVPKSSAFGKL